MGDENSKRSRQIEFAVKYSGKAVESNEIDANALATSLLGLSNAIEEANSILNVGSNIHVKVRGSFRPGSFIIDIASYLNSDVVQTVFNSGTISTAANVTQILGFVGVCACGVNTVAHKTLIWFYKQTRGKKIIKEKLVDGDNFEITVEGNDNTIIINNEVLRLYKNKKMQQALENTVSPLENEDMSDITFLMDGVEQEKISREERYYFYYTENDIIDKKEDVDTFLITQSNFEGKNTGWRLSFGDSQQKNNKPDDFPVKILDENFLQKVFLKEIIISNEGTVIKARYRKITRKAERLTVNWEILEVINYDLLSNNHIKRSTNNTKKLDQF